MSEKVRLAFIGSGGIVQHRISITACKWNGRRDVIFAAVANATLGSREIAASSEAEVGAERQWREPSLTHMIPVACAGCT